MARKRKPANADEAPRTLNSILAEDLKRWGRDEAEQEFPHRPEDFLDLFPEAATEQALVDNVWWWRYAGDSEKCARVFPPWSETQTSWPRLMHQMFKDHFEPSAYFYEFRARYKDRCVWDFGRPWIRCSDEQRRSLDCLLPSKYPSKLNLHLDRPEDFWVTLGKYNLLLNDETLVRRFKDEIKRKRKELDLERPATGLGVRRRPISWMPIEAMDIQKYKVRPLSDGERSALTKARRRYEKTCDELGLPP